MKNIKQLQDKLDAATSKRATIESELSGLQKDISELHRLIELKAKELSDAKDSESALLQKLINVQKEGLKEMVSLKSLKDKIIEKKSIIDDIRERGKTLMGIIDTKIESKWFEENYTKYKNECVKLGEEIKSREDFKQVADKLSKTMKTIKEIDFIKALKSEDILIKKDLESKQEGLMSWLNSNPEETSYESYQKYLFQFYNLDSIRENIYANNPGSFSRLVKKYLKH